MNNELRDHNTFLGCNKKKDNIFMGFKNISLQEPVTTQENKLHTKCGRTRDDFEWCEMLVRGYLGRLSLVACDEGMIGEFLPLEEWLTIAIENGLKASYGSLNPEIFIEDVYDVLTEWETDRIQIGDHFFHALPVGEDDILFGFIEIGESDGEEDQEPASDSEDE